MTIVDGSLFQPTNWNEETLDATKATLFFWGMRLRQLLIHRVTHSNGNNSWVWERQCITGCDVQRMNNRVNGFKSKIIQTEKVLVMNIPKTWNLDFDNSSLDTTFKGSLCSIRVLFQHTLWKATGLKIYFFVAHMLYCFFFCRYRLFSILLKKRIFISETRWYQVFKNFTRLFCMTIKIFSAWLETFTCAVKWNCTWRGGLVENRGGNQRLHQSRGSPKIPSAKKDKQDSIKFMLKRDMKIS